VEHITSDPLCKKSTARSVMDAKPGDRGRTCRVCTPAPSPEPGLIKGLPENLQPRSRTLADMLDEAIKKPFMDGYSRTRAENHYTFPAPKSESDPDWTKDFFASPPQGSPVAPAELPAETRQSIAQMYATYAEFKRTGFSEKQAWDLVKSGWVTACAVQAQWHLMHGGEE